MDKLTVILTVLPSLLNSIVSAISTLNSGGAVDLTPIREQITELDNLIKQVDANDAEWRKTIG